MKMIELAQMYWRFHVSAHHAGAKMMERDALDCWFDICERVLEKSAASPECLGERHV